MNEGGSRRFALPARLPRSENGRASPAIASPSASSCQRMKNQSRMMIGIGTPNSHNMIERIDANPLIVIG
jgi:hypothetical protein